MSHKIDERKENIQKIKKDIENTQKNAEFAEDVINSVSKLDSFNNVNMLREQNKRRHESVELMVEDVKERVFD